VPALGKEGRVWNPPVLSMWKNLTSFLRKHAASDSLLVEFEDSLLLIVDPEQLASNLQGKLRQVIDLEDVAVYLADSGGAARGFTPVEPVPVSVSGLSRIRESGRMADWFRVNREILIFDENAAVVEYLRDELRPFLDGGMRLAFPLVSMDRLIGIVFVRSGQASFSETQLVNLQRLGKQAGLAFENALLFKERLRQNERMNRAEQLATMGQFAAGIAHELRNPLTAIRSTVQFLSGEFQEGSEQQKLSESILEEVDRLNGIVGNLLSLAQPAQSKPAEIHLRQEIEKCLSVVDAKARSQDVKLELVCEDRLPNLVFDPAELRQVLLNVIMNGLQAMPRGGTLSVEVRCLDEAAHAAGAQGDRALIEITDQGPGIPRELRERVFEPFFTTKPGGTGLGLAVCRSIVRRYDGDIWIEPVEGGGTRVKMVLVSK